MPSSDEGGAGADCMDNRNLKDLEARLGYSFRRAELLERALTHPSVSYDPAHVGGDYERLEFLGDRVLGLLVAEMLFLRFPNEAEGLLARRLAQLVRKETLASVADGIGLGDHMRLEMGMSEPSGRSNPGLLSNACEAVIAALYLDGGLEVARRFVAAQWERRIEADVAPPSDSKTELQEWAQGRGLPLPRYLEVDRSGPPHAPVFTISVEVDGHLPMEGQGRSKRAAEQDAAGQLLRLLTGGDP